MPPPPLPPGPLHRRVPCYPPPPPQLCGHPQGRDPRHPCPRTAAPRAAPVPGRHAPAVGGGGAALRRAGGAGGRHPGPRVLHLERHARGGGAGERRQTWGGAREQGPWAQLPPGAGGGCPQAGAGAGLARPPMHESRGWRLACAARGVQAAAPSPVSGPSPACLRRRPLLLLRLCPHPSPCPPPPPPRRCRRSTGALRCLCCCARWPWGPPSPRLSSWTLRPGTCAAGCC
jgi:hypothetical protein